MRKLLALILLVVAMICLLVFTEPGQGVLRAFGVPAPDCMAARWLYALGYHVPQCQCGNCSEPPISEPSNTR